MKRVKISLDSKNFQSVLNSLTLENNNVEIYIDLKDDKENYKILSGCPDVLDWDFCNNDVHAERLPEKKESIEIRSEKTLENIGVELVRDFNTLATFVEAYWNYEKTENTWDDSKFQEYYGRVGTNNVTINHVILKTLIECYYKEDWKVEHTLDTVRRLKGINVKNYTTISELIATLYKS